MTKNSSETNNKSRKSKNSNSKSTQKDLSSMEKFKMEAASEVGVDLKKGYNGDLTAKEAGSIGGRMVKKMIDSYKDSKGEEE